MNRFRFCIFAVLFLLGMGTHFESMAQTDYFKPSNVLYYYSGVMGGSETVEFNVHIKDMTVSGSYFVTDEGEMFLFSGRIDASYKGIGVLVYDKSNTYVASIEAQFYSEGGNFGQQLNGTWKSADGKLTRKVRLTKVAEFASTDIGIGDDDHTE